MNNPQTMTTFHTERWILIKSYLNRHLTVWYSLRAASIVTLGLLRRDLGVFSSLFQHLPSPAALNLERKPSEVSVSCEKEQRGAAAMELFSVFVSAVLVCVVIAGIPHDGIHWTYTGRHVLIWELSMNLKKKKSTVMGNLWQKSIGFKGVWCKTCLAAYPVRICFGRSGNKNLHFPSC